ncbi:MAG: hypothetical protein M1828_007346 [Chrysothrix sp. TS-e1954]|nr:MAG: hypothetical protein M1828_007346 [Chrysothrix sp. TS-e1954]
MVNLPSFQAKRSSKSQQDKRSSRYYDEKDQDGKANGHDHAPPAATVKRATRTRRIWSILSSLLLFISLIFIIMVEIGNIKDKPVLRDIWFINLNLSNVVPESVPNATVLNSIAQTLGLHDFYQVGLWGYCEGFNDRGVTDCSNPKTLYWFNPVTIIQNQLLAGSSIQLPQNLTSILHLIMIASKVMFGFFLVSACLTFILIFITPLSIISRWVAFLITILTFMNAALVTIAAAIGTAMFILMRNAFKNSITEVNIEATIGVTMFALMWVAAACSIFAWLIQFSLMCCCASRRDVKRGKKKGSKKAYA